MEIEDAEVLFAQKLADCDPAIRKKAFSRLRHWITSKMKQNGFTRPELITLWKGLYYCMWMQDKPLLHEELADRLCALGDFFFTVEQHILYLDTFLETIAREWINVDRWRVDKFLMLCRRFFRHALAWIKSKNWDEEIWQQLTELYSKTVWTINADDYPEELRCHFASIYLDELDLASVFKLPQEKIAQFLDPYLKLLAAPISGLFFGSIQKEIFDAILVDFAENSFPRSKKPRRGTRHVVLLDPVGSSEALQIDYGKIADTLFETGKSKTLKPNRRKKIYNLAKQYRTAANGQNPFSETIDIPEDIDDVEVDKAAREFLKWNNSKTKKRRRKENRDQEADEDDEIQSDNDEAERPPVKIRKTKLRPQSQMRKKKRIDVAKLKKRKI